MAKLEKHFMSHRYVQLKNCYRGIFCILRLIFAIFYLPPFAICPFYNIVFKNGLGFEDLCCGFSLEALNGFMFGVDATKSLILTLACIERVITVEEAVRS